MLQISKKSRAITIWSKRENVFSILGAPILFSPTYQDEGNNRKDKRGKGERI